MTATDLEKALSRAFDFGERYWQQADSESYSQNKKSFATMAAYRAFVDETVAAFVADGDHADGATK